MTMMNRDSSVSTALARARAPNAQDSQSHAGKLTRTYILCFAATSAQAGFVLWGLTATDSILSDLQYYTAVLDVHSTISDICLKRQVP